MARFNFKSLQARFLSAVVLIPAVLTVLYFGGWVFFAFVAMLTLVSLYEWVSVAIKCPGLSKFLFVLPGVPYIIVSMACCYLIFEYLGLSFAVVFLLMIWGSDIGAYFSGKIIGGPKMAETISPNKTWAGFVGACVTPGLIGVFAGFVMNVFISDTVTVTAASGVFYAALFVVGVVTGIAGQSGDLLVSMMKRRAGVKDTGAIIPGHGGVLDRIDSMLLAAPVFLGLMIGVLGYVS